MLHFKTGLTPANFISVLLKLSQLTEPAVDQARSEQQSYSLPSWKCFSLFSKDTEGKVGRKDDLLSPLNTPMSHAAGAAGKEDKKHHRIQGNPIANDYIFAMLVEEQAYYSFPCRQRFETSLVAFWAIA